jgi:hypothetical protein
MWRIFQRQKIQNEALANGEDVVTLPPTVTSKMRILFTNPKKVHATFAGQSWPRQGPFSFTL